ncbi:hypothetical protein Leryth_019305 [Lithospermum erythrorhizon]|nr:hypothetical protein Leryth_019305 [Lithospermum erythrorhizon]
MEDESLVEEKEEVMISPCGGKPFKKMAYFLKSNVPQLIQEEEEGEDGNLKLKLPSLSAKCKWPLEVKFYCWSYPSEKWEEWVRKMHERCHNIWKKCCLDEAILNSVYRICKNEELVFNVAERWCSETSSFLFPWGEATVTLEDVMVLGGFPVLGCLPFSLPLHNEENIIIRQLKKPKNAYGEWLDCFMGSGSSVEHEAFLAMWLSKFVFPGNDVEKINENVFPIAVHLARGTKIALAPAVLAGIYRDLTLLSGTMAEASKFSNLGVGDSLEMGISSPMQLVQIWVWERLVPLRPLKENFIEKGDPRVSRWHAIEQEDTINMRPAIDSAGEAFLWRPYALKGDPRVSRVLHRYYREFADWLPINGKMSDDDDGTLESFAQCLRVCELQGIDCKELYQPHRVAMQFGYDQDVPKWIQRSNEFLEFAWYRPFADDAFLFIPSRLGEADVSYRYMEWWRNRVLVPVDTIPGMKRRARKARRPAPRNTLQNHPKGGKNNQASALLVNCTNGYCRNNTLMHPVKTEQGIEPYDLPPPPGFPPKQYLSKAYVPPGFPKKIIAVAPPPSFLPKGNVAEPIYPPGFSPKKNVANLDDLPPPGFPPKKNVATFQPKKAVEEGLRLF